MNPQEKTEDPVRSISNNLRHQMENNCIRSFAQRQCGMSSIKLTLSRQRFQRPRSTKCNLRVIAGCNCIGNNNTTNYRMHASDSWSAVFSFGGGCMIHRHTGHRTYNGAGGFSKR